MYEASGYVELVEAIDDAHHSKHIDTLDETTLVYIYIYISYGMADFYCCMI